MTPFDRRFVHAARGVLHTFRRPPVLHFLHVGKTGGTAVKWALQHAPRAPDWNIRLHPHRVLLRQIPEGEKVFFLLRDPVSRFVSGFYSRQRQGQPRYSVPWTIEEERAFTVFETPNALGEGLTSRDTVLRSDAIAAMKAIRHVRDSYWAWFHSREYFESRIPDIFFIGHQETLEEDIERLAHKLRLAGTLQLPKSQTEAHVGPMIADRTLSEEARANLRDWYKSDYEFLEYCNTLGLR